MKLSAWAKTQGICYTTAWRMFRDGRLPVPSEQLATGTVIVHVPAQSSGGIALYARVSSGDQKADLDRQLVRLTEYAVSNRLFIVDTVKEVGSGLNGHRKGMMRLLRNPDVHTIVVEHRDRLMRFGFEYVESALAAQNRKIVVIEPEEMTGRMAGNADDIVRDLHEVIVSMCTRLYGKRSAKNRAKKAWDALNE
ncbi:MAG TPA: IS607 family transposase [Acidiferrobacter sp.]|nr:IS607 family transposase [Acidiferrobacter sp.]